MTRKAYIGIGSNLGDKLKNCLKAIELIRRIPSCEVRAASEFYRTEPLGVKGQDWYVNSVISLAVGISAQDLLKKFLDIEACMGRQRAGKNDSRIIDLDILLFGQEVISENNLTVPHRYMHLRRFVLVPMAELAPDLIHPVAGNTMRELLKKLPKDGQMVLRLEER